MRTLIVLVSVALTVVYCQTTREESGVGVPLVGGKRGVGEPEVRGESGVGVPLKQRPKMKRCEKACTAGEYCDGLSGQCKCLSRCDGDWAGSFNRAICVDGSVTYNHNCDFYRNMCYCKSNSGTCGGSAFKGHRAGAGSYISYYGACLKNPENYCDWKTEKPSYGERMAIWFRNLLNQKLQSVSARDTHSILRPLSIQARQAAARITSKPTGTYNVPVGLISFWFCDMDLNNDRTLNAFEQSILTRALAPTTTCIFNWLKECGGSSISFGGFHNCMGIPKNETMDCGSFRK